MVIGLLLWIRPKGQDNFLSVLIPVRKLVLCVGLFILVGGATYGWIAQMRFEQLSEVGQVLESNTVQLEPAAWIGKEFPIRNYVVDGQGLMTGEWTILLSSPGCSECERVKRNLRKNAGEEVLVAILQISGKKLREAPIDTAIPVFTVDNGISWMVETPVVLGLDDGVVRNVQTRKELLPHRAKDAFWPGALR